MRVRNIFICSGVVSAPRRGSRTPGSASCRACRRAARSRSSAARAAAASCRSRRGRTARRTAAAGTGRPSATGRPAEAEPLAGLHRRPGEHDALDRVALQRVDAQATARYVLPVPAGPMPKLMSVLEDRGEVVALPRRAAVQFAPPRWQRRLRLASGLLGRRRTAAALDEVQLDVIDRDGPLATARKCCSASTASCARGCGPSTRNWWAAPADRHLQLGLDLPEVRVQGAGDVGQFAVVASAEKPALAGRDRRTRRTQSCSGDRFAAQRFAAQRVRQGQRDAQVDHPPHRGLARTAGGEVDDPVVPVRPISSSVFLFDPPRPGRAASSRPLRR